MTSGLQEQAFEDHNVNAGVNSRLKSHFVYLQKQIILERGGVGSVGGNNQSVFNFLL